MKIAVIGAGHVGGALATGFARAGHELVLGVRDPDSDKTRDLLTGLDRPAVALPVDEAIDACPVVALALPFAAVRDVVTDHDAWSGKTLIDCTNPIGPGFQLLYGHSTSGAEEIASWADGAHVVKCFNTTGFENMLDPRYGGEKATMFLCGDDDSAKQLTRELCEGLGFEPCDTGPLRNARYLEPLAMIWIHLARVQGQGADLAFKLMRR